MPQEQPGLQTLGAGEAQGVVVRPFLAAQAVQAWLLFLTLARNYSLVVRLQLLVVTPSIHLIQVVL
jgi:hypothetical protein